jgi:mannan endo-1,4-beta-mannosidase
VILTSILLTVTALVGCARSAGAPGGFVYRDGAQLMLNGAPYRFVGVNNYDLTGCHTGDPISDADADNFFAQLPPNSMTRVWAFQEWGIDSVARTVQLAERHNQKLVLTLADGAGFCSAPHYDAGWYEQGFRGAYLAWVTQVASRFRSSAAVGMWELMNEPGSTAADLSQTVIKQFYNATAAHLKLADPNHLVSTGALAPWQSFQNGASGYADVHSGPDIDVVSVHEFDYAYSEGKTIVSPHFETALEAARSIGKPVFVGETGVSLRDGCMTADERADVLRQKFDDYLGAGAAGVLYWVVVGPPNDPGTVCSSDFGAQDPMLGGPVMRMIGGYR